MSNPDVQEAECLNPNHITNCNGAYKDCQAVGEVSKDKVTSESGASQGASSSISKILEDLITLCGGSIWWDYKAKEKDPCISAAQQEIEALMLDIIGEDEQQIWDEEGSWCEHCEFQPTDDTKNCICIFRNRLRAEQRAKLKGKDGTSK